MKKTLHWLDENLEEFILVIFLIAMTLIMGIQVLCRYVLGMSLSWSEELTRYLFIWCGFLSVSYCSKKCLSIKIEQFVAIFPRRGKAIFKVVYGFHRYFGNPNGFCRPGTKCQNNTGKGNSHFHPGGTERIYTKLSP